MPRLLAATILLIALLVSGCSSREAHQVVGKSSEAKTTLGEMTPQRALKPNYEVALVVDMDRMGDNASSAWLGYLMARDMWISDHLATAQPSDFLTYQPRFDEELTGRWTLTELWRGMRKKGSAPDQYLDALVLIEEHGYLEPYVWQYHYQDAWGPKPGDLPWVRYEQWMEDRLPGFEPETCGSIRLLKPGATAEQVKVSKLK